MYHSGRRYSRSRSRSRSPRRKDRRRSSSRDRDRRGGDRDYAAGGSSWAGAGPGRGSNYQRHQRSSRSPPARQNRHRSRSRSGSVEIEIIKTVEHSTVIDDPAISLFTSDARGTGQGSIRPVFVPEKLKERTQVLNDKATAKPKTEEEQDMMNMMGFCGFNTTKQKQKFGAVNAWGVNVQQKRKYRQYMNRKGGFNRPLDPVA